MLVLTRRLGEELILTDTLTGTIIKICLLTMSGRQARIGIDAPPHVDIIRDDAIKIQKTGV